MKDLINRVQQQLDDNHAVEAEDIQELVDHAKHETRLLPNEKKNLRKIRNYFGESDITAFEHWAYKWLNDFINHN